MAGDVTRNGTEMLVLKKNQSHHRDFFGITANKTRKWRNLITFEIQEAFKKLKQVAQS
jgi:hypothetical protein